MQYKHGARDPYYSKTCPQYCGRQEWVVRTLRDEKYLESGLGCILDLEAQYLELLEIAKAEKAAWLDADIASMRQ